MNLTCLTRRLDAAAVEIKDISGLLSNKFTDFLTWDVQQIGLASLAVSSMSAVITGITKTGFVDPGVLLYPMLFHQGPH